MTSVVAPDLLETMMSVFERRAALGRGNGEGIGAVQHRQISCAGRHADDRAAHFGEETASHPQQQRMVKPSRLTACANAAISSTRCSMTGTMDNHRVGESGPVGQDRRLPASFAHKNDWLGAPRRFARGHEAGMMAEERSKCSCVPIMTQPRESRPRPWLPAPGDDVRAGAQRTGQRGDLERPIRGR